MSKWYNKWKKDKQEDPVERIKDHYAKQYGLDPSNIQGHSHAYPLKAGNIPPPVIMPSFGGNGGYGGILIYDLTDEIKEIATEYVSYLALEYLIDIKFSQMFNDHQREELTVIANASECDKGILFKAVLIEVMKKVG